MRCGDDSIPHALVSILRRHLLLGPCKMTLIFPALTIALVSKRQTRQLERVNLRQRPSAALPDGS